MTWRKVGGAQYFRVAPTCGLVIHCVDRAATTHRSGFLCPKETGPGGGATQSEGRAAD